MARPLRVEYAGGCYHVINRGNYRRNLFLEKRGGEAFERVIGEAAERYRWHVHAYVIMRNHFHLALELTEPNLSEGMRWLQATWVRRYNAYRKLVGKPFQGRYKALLVERGRALGQVCHYIHLNPVRAGIVVPSKVADYAWSSLSKFGQKNQPAWLDSSIVLQEAGELSDTKRGWSQYKEYLEFLATDQESQKELTSQRMSRGWCLGGNEFRDEMRREIRERGASLDRERFEGIAGDELKEEKLLLWQERLGNLARAARIDLEKLGPRKSDPSKVLLAAAMKQTASAPNAWLAEKLQMGKPASVSQFSRRWMLTESGRKAVQGLLSKVKH